MWFAGQARRGPEAGRPKALRTGFHLERGQRVGLFGGSFNPPHSGHAHVARTAMARLDLDRVLWLVSPQNPLKAAGETADLSERMAQTRDVAKTASQGLSMIVSDVESRIQARYTIDTLRALKARHPGVHFVWIMGADNLAQFHRWRGWLQIMQLMPVAIIARPRQFTEEPLCASGQALCLIAHRRCRQPRPCQPERTGLGLSQCPAQPRILLRHPGG